MEQNENEKMLNEIFNEEDEIDYDLIMENFGLDMSMLNEVLNGEVQKLEVSYVKMEDEVKSLNYAYDTDSGFDLYSVEEKKLKPFGRDIFSTGIKLNIPEHYEIQIRSKSGLALKDGIMVLNSPGTVDQGYTGELRVILFNTSELPITIKKGQKIAQAILCPVVCGKWINLVEVGAIQNKDRNENGFGSTGLI